jgi:polysaccharide biosynthesis/export protein
MTLKRMLAVLMVTIISLPCTGGQAVDTANVKALLKQNGYSSDDSRLKDMAKDIRDKNRQGMNIKDTALSVGPDSLMLQKKEPPRGFFGEDTSMYEYILRNKIIDPDSIIKDLPVFGHDVFRNIKSLSFTPENNLATPADYIVGAGDEINILVWGRMNEEYKLKVDREGRINIPHQGPVAVAGMPFTVMEKTVLDRIQSIEGVQASVTMGDLRSISVFMVGDVKSPGMYTLSSLSNVTNAIFAAGGPNKRGSLRNIHLKRNGSVIATIDFYDFLLAGKDNAGTRLKSGDVIVVPIVKKMAAIAGNVRRSALYEIRQGDRLKDLIALAGGISPAAWTNRIQIERFQDNQYQIVLDVEADKNQDVPSCNIEDGDIVKIFPIVLKDDNAVYLSGNVYRPGKYEYKTGMKVTDIIPDFKSLLPETYFEYAIILRKDPPGFLDRLIPFNLEKAINGKTGTDNMPLQPRDAVIIYSRDYFEPDRTVYIGGAVNNPGKQKILDNMKVRDLIIQAGGLLEEASDDKGELYRRVFDKEIVATQKIEFNVRLSLIGDEKNNIELKKYDMVYIRSKKGWEEEKRVSLKGEMTYPGEYILLKGETLGSLIERAGGFTIDAYLPAATLTRVSVKDLERKRNEDYVNRLQSDALTMTTEMVAKQQQAGDVQNLLLQQQQLMNRMRNGETAGRVVIDMTTKKSYDDFLLEDGDSLFVPKKTGTVSVIGEVYNPATFRIESGSMPAKFYVELAGGAKPNADMKKIYVIKANGSVVTNRSTDIMEYALCPADAIVVPQKVEYKNNFKVFMESLTSIVQISSLFLSIATIWIAIKSN